MKGTITKYRKKDGRVSWGYYFKVGDEQFTKSGFPTKDAAVDARDSAMRKEQGLPPTSHVAKPDASPTNKGDTRALKDYLAYWLDEHAALRCQETTMEDYRKLAKYLVQHLGHVRICDLKAAPIQEMVNRLQRHGGAKTAKYPGGPSALRKTDSCHRQPALYLSRGCGAP